MVLQPRLGAGKCLVLAQHRWHSWNIVSHTLNKSATNRLPVVPRPFCIVRPEIELRSSLIASLFSLVRFIEVFRCICRSAADWSPEVTPFASLSIDWTPRTRVSRRENEAAALFKLICNYENDSTGFNVDTFWTSKSSIAFICRLVTSPHRARSLLEFS